MTGAVRALRSSRVGTVVLVCVFALAATGCSVRQVQTWFAVRGNPSVSYSEAKSIADLVNRDKPAECDEFYSWCVPNNISEAHCAGDGGPGWAVPGEVRISRWDHLGLDPDGDGRGCITHNAEGSLDDVAPTAAQDGIRVAGWAFDRDSTTPGTISVAITSASGSSTHTAVASVRRPDLAALGMGLDRGFDVTIPVAPGSYEICVTALNSGRGLDLRLGCRNIDVAWRTYMLSLVNAERAKVDAPPLAACPALDRAAQGHTDDMETNGYLAHTGSDGSTPSERANREGYAGGVGENAAGGYRSVDEVMNGWMTSPGHRANLLTPYYRHLGLGRSSAGFGFFWAQKFGISGTC